MPSVAAVSTGSFTWSGSSVILLFNGLCVTVCSSGLVPRLFVSLEAALWSEGGQLTCSLALPPLCSEGGQSTCSLALPPLWSEGGQLTCSLALPPLCSEGGQLTCSLALPPLWSEGGQLTC